MGFLGSASFHIDLLFCNIRLRCYVMIDLKFAENPFVPYMTLSKQKHRITELFIRWSMRYITGHRRNMRGTKISFVIPMQRKSAMCLSSPVASLFLDFFSLIYPFLNRNRYQIIMPNFGPHGINIVFLVFFKCRQRIYTYLS